MAAQKDKLRKQICNYQRENSSRMVKSRQFPDSDIYQICIWFGEIEKGRLGSKETIKRKISEKSISIQRKISMFCFLTMKQPVWAWKLAYG